MGHYAPALPDALRPGLPWDRFQPVTFPLCPVNPRATLSVPRAGFSYILSILSFRRFRVKCRNVPLTCSS
ncbi:hypothetical protein CE91St42_16980 [Oscillospiraceae bacterium]|nr:hypothetical protein CE91St42_16980 [Oscillospiraceae bacterium]